MFRFFTLICLAFLCKCFLNTKYQIYLDYTIPSALVNFDKSFKYTNITIGRDSFLCVLNNINEYYDNSNVCENKDTFENGTDSEQYEYVEQKLKENYLLNYVDEINYDLAPSKELRQLLKEQEQKETETETEKETEKETETETEKETGNEKNERNSFNHVDTVQKRNKHEEGIEYETEQTDALNQRDETKSHEKSPQDIVHSEKKYHYEPLELFDKNKEKIKYKENERDTIINRKEESIGNVADRKSSRIINSTTSNSSRNGNNSRDNLHKNDIYGDSINCNFKKIYDYIFMKHKFHVYHKNRIYDKITEDTALKSHIIKGKMLTINNSCLNVSHNTNVLKICINKSVTYFRQKEANKINKEVIVSQYSKGMDLLFSNNTVVQYYTDKKYLFEILFLCGNNNLKINSFEKLEHLHYPLIFEIFQFVHMNLTKLFNIIKNKLKYKEDYFFKTYNMHTYSDKYYKSLKNKLNELLNSQFTNVTHLYRITLSAYMFCNYTDKINPPVHYLLRNVVNKCFIYNKTDAYIYEICFPYSVIKYKTDAFGKVQYPIRLLGATLKSGNEGKPFFEKTYERFPVLKYEFIKMKNIQNRIKASGNNIFDFSNPLTSNTTHSSTSSSSTFSSHTASHPSAASSSTSNIPHNTYFSSAYSSNNASHFPYIRSYIIDKPMEILKYGKERFYKALAFDLKGEKCKDSLGEVHDYITTIYFDCSLHFKNENYTKVINIFQTTECHYYIHIATPFLCAHPTLNTTVPSKNETIRCFKNVHAASSQLQPDSQDFSYGDIYNLDEAEDINRTHPYKDVLKRKTKKKQKKNKKKKMEKMYETEINKNGSSMATILQQKKKNTNIFLTAEGKRKKTKKKEKHTYKNRETDWWQGNTQNPYTYIKQFEKDTTDFDPDILKDRYISSTDKMRLYEFHVLKKKAAKNKKLIYLEAVPANNKMIFGRKHDFGLGNYIRKRVYKNKPLYHIGNVVKHKYWNYHAVVVSWDMICYAPKEWKKNVFSEYPVMHQNTPYYLILINKRQKQNKAINVETETTNPKHNLDLLNENNKDYNNSNVNYINKTNEQNFNFAYVPESSLVYSNRMIYNKHLPQFFEKYNHSFHFYIPKKNHILWKIFPYDFFNLVS